METSFPLQMHFLLKDIDPKSLWSSFISNQIHFRLYPFVSSHVIFCQFSYKYYIYLLLLYVFIFKGLSCVCYLSFEREAPFYLYIIYAQQIYLIINKNETSILWYEFLRRKKIVQEIKKLNGKRASYWTKKWKKSETHKAEKSDNKRFSDNVLRH